MFRRNAVLFGLILWSAAPVAAAAQWQLLGERRVSFAAERDVIEVGAREGLFTAVRLEVQDGNLEMFNVRIVFGDGSVFSPETRLTFLEGSRSRVIDLPGQARVVRRITFAYRSRLRRGRATVRAYGQEARASVTETAPLGPPAVAGWTPIGSRSVNFRVDHDAVVAVGQGAFRQVRFTVDGGDLELFDVRITFGDGSSYSPATRLYFRANSLSRVIDLPGGARIVRRIDFFYRSVAGGREGRALVHVYGR